MSHNTNKIRWLRAAYWIGAIIDAYVAVLMLLPDLLPSFPPVALPVDGGMRWALRFGAGLMIGWTALLLWADRQPVARKGVIWLTLFPIVGIWLNNVASVLNGVAAGSIAVELAGGTTLMILFVALTIYTRDLEPAAQAGEAAT